MNIPLPFTNCVCAILFFLWPIHKYRNKNKFLKKKLCAIFLLRRWTIYKIHLNLFYSMAFTSNAIKPNNGMRKTFCNFFLLFVDAVQLRFNKVEQVNFESCVFLCTLMYIEMQGRDWWVNVISRNNSRLLTHFLNGFSM